ncbi:uncharacterized protein N7482_004075 [Penicillium canariense]|uniref:Hydrophobin n=1 Tax=Penicillium canariense TaxID=189055 RepID=A0A9W9I7V6_9EURO|nr:uncharacterized protein N7482_004075 [Penicillium canariense]KAJ5168481.1 hypothetical protein N7482_004075 [Penicillium canariense]
MKLYMSTSAALFITPSFACDFLDIGKDCNWEGSWPLCGTTDDHIGIKIDGRTLVEWTRDRDLKDICKNDKDRDGDCCSNYGHSCVSGYKRLWCKHYTMRDAVDVADDVLDGVLPAVLP